MERMYNIFFGDSSFDDDSVDARFNDNAVAEDRSDATAAAAATSTLYPRPTEENPFIVIWQQPDDDGDLLVPETRKLKMKNGKIVHWPTLQF